MYSKKVRDQALALLDKGLTPGEASVAMGGSPSRAIIYKWSKGETPTGTRGPQCVLTAPQKEDAVLRVVSGEDIGKVAADVGCSVPALRQWKKLWLAGGEVALRTRIDHYLNQLGD